jgi:hypothetical protein
MAKLSGNVHVHKTATNAQGHVYIEETRMFGPGDDVPADWAKLITNPGAWDDGDMPSDDGDKPPARNEAKAAWVDWAVSQGADRAAAEAMSKDALVAEYGG